MGARDRVKKYREVGGASDLVRVEVLVPRSRRDDIVADAARLRADFRERKEHVRELCMKATERYSVRIFDNVDLARIPGIMNQAPVIANALFEKGDARAFVLGRRIQAALEN